MTAIGADPEALDAAAAEFRRASQQLDAVIGRIGSRLDRTRWDGPDGTRFRRQWQVGHRVRLHESAAACTALSGKLTRQAADQRRASARPGAASAAPIGGDAGGRSRMLTPLPASVDVYTGQVQATYGFLSGSVAGTIVVEHLRSGRVRVSHTDQVGAGVASSAGASAAVTTDGTALGAGTSAGASAQLEGSVTRRWTVEAEAVPILLAALALEESAAGVPFRAADTVTGGLHDVLSLFGVNTPVGAMASFPLLPDTDRVERLAGLSGSASALAGSGPLTGIGSTSGRLLAGTASEGTTSSLVVVYEGSGAAALTGSLQRTLGVRVPGSGLPSVDLAARVEVPVPSRAPMDERPILVTFRSSVGGEQVLTRVAVDTRAAGPAATRFARAVGDLSHGEVDDALASLHALHIPAAATEVQVSTAVLERHAVSVPVSGTGASVTPSGSHTSLTYVPPAD